MARVKDSLIRKQEEDQEIALADMEFQHYTQKVKENKELKMTKKLKKVAFDVQGTLLGNYTDKVVALFKWFEAKGCDMHIWSYGGRMMAKDAAVELGLEACCQSKVEKLFGDEDAELAMDICVDDQPNDAMGLSASTVISVREIPDNFDEFNTKFGHLLG